MGSMASQITNLAIVYSAVYLGADKKNIKALRHWSFPAQMASNAKNVSIWWRQHAVAWHDPLPVYWLTPCYLPVPSQQKVNTE